MFHRRTPILFLIFTVYHGTLWCNASNSNAEEMRKNQSGTCESPPDARWLNLELVKDQHVAVFIQGVWLKCRVLKDIGWGTPYTQKITFSPEKAATWLENRKKAATWGFRHQNHYKLDIPEDGATIPVECKTQDYHMPYESSGQQKEFRIDVHPSRVKDPCQCAEPMDANTCTNHGHDNRGIYCSIAKKAHDFCHQTKDDPTTHYTITKMAHAMYKNTFGGNSHYYYSLRSCHPSVYKEGAPEAQDVYDAIEVDHGFRVEFKRPGGKTEVGMLGYRQVNKAGKAGIIPDNTKWVKVDENGRALKAGRTSNPEDPVGPVEVVVSSEVHMRLPKDSYATEFSGVDQPGQCATTESKDGTKFCCGRNGYAREPEECICGDTVCGKNARCSLPTLEKVSKYAQYGINGIPDPTDLIWLVNQFSTEEPKFYPECLGWPVRDGLV